MEYGQTFDGYICNDNFIKHPGYQTTRCEQKYFSKDVVRIISAKVTQLLEGVDPLNRKIVVADHLICNIMSNL